MPGRFSSNVLRILSITLIALAQLPAAAAACSGADPALMPVTVKSVSTDGGVNVYTIGGKVTNVGNAGQSSNVLQFVEIYQGGDRLDVRGIPPLRPGQSYAWTYVWRRASDAGMNSTTMHFRISMRQPAQVPSAQDCDASNDTARLTF